MTSADAAAITVTVMIPFLIGGRYVVRRSRGEAINGGEIATALGALAIAAAFVALTRAPARLVTLALPSAMTMFGVALLWLERRRVNRDRTGRFLGLAAVVAGIGA